MQKNWNDESSLRKSANVNDVTVSDEDGYFVPQ